jgi:hypothetical protein
MNLRRLWIVMPLLMAGYLVVSCAMAPTTRTDIIGSWKANDYHGKLSNFLIVSHSEEPGIRAKFESIIASRLNEAGLRAAASSDVMPAGEKINRETIRAAMAGKGFDAVMVSRLIDVDQSMVYVPPTPVTGFDNSFDNFSPVIASPAYIEPKTVIFMQLDLYDAASQRLVWSLKSRTVNHSNISDFVNSLAQVVINELKANDLI